MALLCNKPAKSAKVSNQALLPISCVLVSPPCPSTSLGPKIFGNVSGSMRPSCRLASVMAR